jgi:hypothetical protein
MRIVSGGQSGVDRAALDAALALGLPCGGWCPRGRRAEDGEIPAHYPLRETPSSGFAQRTEWNVRDADATLVLTSGRPIGGTALTIRLARRLGRPLLVVDLDAAAEATLVGRWIERQRIGTLNVAGPRESQRPGIQRQARRFLEQILRRVTDAGSA